MPQHYEMLPRETANLERETAEARTFSEEEHDAILASRIQQETAALESDKAGLAEQVTTLTAEKAELEAKIDVLTAEKAAVEAEFAEYKEDLERKAEVAKLRGERVSTVREAAPHLAEDFLTDERAQRWAEMETAAFDDLVEGLKASAPAGGGAKTPARETAMTGAPVEPVKGSAGNKFFDHFKGA